MAGDNKLEVSIRIGFPEARVRLLLVSMQLNLQVLLYRSKTRLSLSLTRANSLSKGMIEISK